MILFPPAKINFGLYVTDKRTDGYHNIDTLFYPIGFSDVLEVVPDPEVSSGTIVTGLSGLVVEGPAESNLVVRAYHLLNARTALPGVRAYLHKCIPTGAGLGGGSSDGASMLLALREMFVPDLSGELLFELALQLGSDCPFFLNPVPSVARGRGEELKPAAPLLRGMFLQLYHPGTGISTAGAYRNVQVGLPETPSDQIGNVPVAEWKLRVQNSFEPFAFGQVPEIRRIRETLYDAGAVYASMTGSGSAVYGLFQRQTAPDPRIADYLIWEEQL